MGHLLSLSDEPSRFDDRVLIWRSGPVDSFGRTHLGSATENELDGDIDDTGRGLFTPKLPVRLHGSILAAKH